jgi:hypothetical protein
MAGIDVLMKLEGAEKLRRELKRQEVRFFGEMARALPEEGEALMQAANAQAPRATGTLAASSSVTKEIDNSDRTVRVMAAYLDEKAAAVHEGIHWGVKVEDTKGFKWFERAKNAFEAGVVGRIGDRLRRIVGGG